MPDPVGTLLDFIDCAELATPWMPKTIKERLIDGEVTEEQFVDMLEARGISLPEAIELADNDLLALLNFVGVIGNFDRVMLPRFTVDVDELNIGMDIRQILSDNAIRETVDA